MSSTYVEVMVADATYHGQEALTYYCDNIVPIGSIVEVQLKNKNVLGIVVSTTKKPMFKVKSVERAIELPPIPKKLLDLLAWMKAYYPGPSGILTSLFLPAHIPKKINNYENSFGKNNPTALPPLTNDQKQALSQLGGPGLHILHGETGSGKTRVYMELAQKAMAQGKTSVILTPEIGLTSQLTSNFKSIFGERVILLHSQMTDSARYKAWSLALKSNEPLIIVGPRSALFTPVENIGLIVVDESHEMAYKQDRSPYYHASFVAAKLAALHQATLILGSATPSVTDYAIAEARQRPIVRMSQTASSSENTDPDIQIIDLKDRSNFGKNSYLSTPLIKEISTTLSKGEQVLVFLNRRGTARVIFCEKCSWQALCPHCDLPLVYHGDAHYMQCHTCARQSPSPICCPDCGNTTIVFRGAGTKAVAETLQKLFPDKKIQRFDTDNKKIERIEQHFETIQRGDIDIIVGTQTIAKGIDLPNLGLVGVVAADSGLSFPDFSAQEKTYQLLHQVIGRVGRGHRKGKAIIQTYNPESPILKMVTKKDWQAFSKKELEERKQYKFPPFYYLLKLTCRRATAKAAEQASQRLADNLSSQNYKILIEGPAPSFYEKSQGKFQWQLIIKARQRSELIKIINTLPANWSYDIDPLNLL